MDYPDIGIFFGRPARSHILSEKLRARGFRVTLYNDRGIPGTYSPVPYGFLPAFARLLSTRHDVYLTSMDYLPSICLYLNRLIRDSPYVFNAVGLKSAEYRDRARRWPIPRLAEQWFYPTLTARVLAGATRIVCNSRYLQNQLIGQFPRYAGKMLTIYNGIEFDRFAAGRRAPLLGMSSDTPTLLAVMTWNYEGKASGARLLIDAMGIIREKYPGARLIIAAKLTHRFHAQAIEAYLRTKPWQEAIHIAYNQTNIPDLLASSTLFVYATPADTSDSLPRALLEAHAAGLPIVATATAGCPEVVADSVTGFLVPYEAETFAGRVMELLADPALRQEMGQAGRVRANDLFSWDRMAEGYAELFVQIASKSTPAVKPKGFVPSTGKYP